MDPLDDPRPWRPTRPGPQPENRVAGTFDEQVRRARLPRVLDDVAQARRQLRDGLSLLAAADRILAGIGRRGR